jgi:hypothetical protein
MNRKNINITNIIAFCKKRKENHFHADLQILLVIAKYKSMEIINRKIRHHTIFDWCWLIYRYFLLSLICKNLYGVRVRVLANSSGDREFKPTPTHLFPFSEPSSQR